MKLESPAFTMEDVRSFMETYLDRERHILADRLQKVSERVAELGPRVKAQTGDEGDWNAHEILAHIAVVSKFYGVLVHRIASGKLDDVNLLEAVNLRDAAGREMSRLPPDELVRMTLADHQRTIQTLRESDAVSLRRTARAEAGMSMTAEDVARMPLVSHLEMHVQQLEQALSTTR